ncbi:MAG: acetylserotonin O-methyltransferase [Dehalococcoidia bacterium]|nr:acetylserotonin O-methyltransferase [Dehalococcoidia bacterium]
MSTTMNAGPETINRIADGAYPALAMLAGMQLDLFTPLEHGPMTAEEIAQAIGVGSAKLKPLLYALVAADLLTVDGDWFANTPESAHFLVSGRPEYIGHRHANMARRWKSVLHTSESILEGKAQAKLDFSDIGEDELEVFARGMHQETLNAGRDLVARYDFSKHRNLVDVGGGTGAMSFAAVEAHPHICATIADLPAMTPITQRSVREAGFSERVQVVTADLVEGTLDGSYDAVIMKSFIQVLNPDQARRALANIHRVTEPGGTVYILGAVLDESRLSPPEAVASSLNFLNVYDGGQSYTEGEYREWLTEAGYVDVGRVVTSSGSSIVTARKPS